MAKGDILALQAFPESHQSVEETREKRRILLVEKLLGSKKRSSTDSSTTRKRSKVTSEALPATKVKIRKSRFLESANGKKLSTDVEILDEAKNYYEHLYMTTTVDVNDHDNIFFPEVTETKLGNNQKESCEGILSATECLENLKTMESGKSPGTDSIPAEFFKVFWDDLSPFLVAALNSSFTQDIFPSHSAGG